MTWIRKRHTLVRMFRPNLECLDNRILLSANPGTAYIATDLVSDLPGVAAVTDPTLVNAFGISLSPNGGAFWVSSNGGGLSELYTGDVGGTAIGQPFKVAIPGGVPTGQVFNSTTDFQVTDGTNTAVAAFIFASESGFITGWNPGVGVVAGASGPSLTAEIGFHATDGAIYKALALGKVGSANFLFATDFHNGKIDVVDGQFHKVTLGANGFENFADPNLPKGYAPFGIAAINGKLYVSYAKQDDAAVDDVAGRGHGFIDVFETNGHFDGRLVSRGDLNSPYGMVLAPTTFGQFGGDLLVGNFGDGRIHAFDPTTGVEQGTLSVARDQPIVIDGLWGLAFGNGKSAGDANALYYAAGPQHESHGLFGKITANAAGTNPVTAVLTRGDLVVTGSRDSDFITVSPDHSGQHIIVRAGHDTIGTFDNAAVGTIHVNGLAGDDVIIVDSRLSQTSVLDGGAGNDYLVGGGGGSNILLGNIGDDVLIGGAARDLLIGGAGADFLFGHRGDDILIGSSTTHDLDPAALMQILNEWNTNASYNDRVAALHAGVTVPKLDASVLIDDGVRDTLFGGFGLDWFLGALPDNLHQMPGEQIN